MYKVFKRILDVTMAIVMVVLGFPFLLVVFIILAFHFKGSPIFRQKRLGFKNEEFIIYKFKTMRDTYSSDGNILPDKDRITKLGLFIRKLSVDELPQIFNILNGTMSFIGPRPLSIRNFKYYTNLELQRHDVRPGISGLAQVNGRNNLNWDKRLSLDVEYVQNISFLLDVNILYKTVVNILLRKDISNSPNIPSLIKTRGNEKTSNDF